MSNSEGETGGVILSLDTLVMRLRLSGVQTGHRVAELAALSYGDLYLHGRRYTVTWRHCKGGKVMYDELPPLVTDALQRWLMRWPRVTCYWH